jgi:hypothetical protein
MSSVPPRPNYAYHQSRIPVSGVHGDFGIDPPLLLESLVDFLPFGDQAEDGPISRAAKVRVQLVPPAFLLCPDKMSPHTRIAPARQFWDNDRTEEVAV